MTIIERGKLWYDYWRLSLLFPKIGKTVQYNEKMYYLEDRREYGIDLTTKFIYRKDDRFWSFEARVLGFGFLLERQSGY